MEAVAGVGTKVEGLGEDAAGFAIARVTEPVASVQKSRRVHRQIP